MNNNYNADMEITLEKRTEELELVSDRLFEKERLLTTYIERISEDLRTPVTNLNLYLKLLKDGRPEKHEQYMQVMEQQLAKLSELVLGIFEVSQSLGSDVKSTNSFSNRNSDSRYYGRNDRLPI